MPTQLDQHKTICAIRDSSGKEVGRIPATAPNATEYIDATVRAHPPS